MTTQEDVFQQMQGLAPEDQQRVLQFVRSLKPRQPRRDPRGMFVERGIHVAIQDIAQARREAWAGFPRDRPKR
jgi:hypothetical protein